MRIVNNFDKYNKNSNSKCERDSTGRFIKQERITKVYNCTNCGKYPPYGGAGFEARVFNYMDKNDKRILISKNDNYIHEYNEYINFINKCIKIGKKIITISPLTGFLGHNEHGSAAGKNVELHNLMDEYKPEIEEVKNIFDAGIKGKAFDRLQVRVVKI